MNASKYKNALMEFGLKEHEAVVYVSALSLGPTPILPIARDTGIRRTTVYEIIKSLISKGLMTTELRGFKKLFCAAHPQNLVSIFENKKNKLDIVVPELTTIYKKQGSEDNIRTYESVDSLKSLYREMLDSFRTGDFCYVISDTDKFLKSDPKFFMDYIEKRARMSLDLKIIISDSETARERKEHQRNYGGQIKILPKGMSLSANFTVTKNIFLTQAVENRMVAITTNNKDIISLQKNIFLALWNSIPE